jgi:serine protease AprX
MVDIGGRGSDKIPVTIRLKVPAGLRGAEVFRLVEARYDAVARLDLDREYGAVPVRPPLAQLDEFKKSEMQLVTLRAFVDPLQLETLRGQPYVDHISRDAPVEPFARVAPAGFAAGHVECARTDKADGTAARVARELGATRLWRAGYTGHGIVVGVVDGGITAQDRPIQFGGWPAIPQEPAAGKVVGGWPEADWGTTAEGWGQHGNMIAFDVQAIAPEAQLWDIRIWHPDDAFASYVSRAEAGFRAAIEHYLAHGVPHILVNAWGLYDSDNGPEYAFDPASTLALHVEHALDVGLLIVWAAGNCGDGCAFLPGSPCGSGDRGPGVSILGPNGHPRVMTVGAATLRGEWCGYTSQGPAALPPNDPDKPDFCGVSQFEGFFPNESGLRPYDGGTSAATGITGGVVALLKQARPDLTQDECKRLLKETARPISTAAAHYGAGAGIIDALRAFRAM